MSLHATPELHDADPPEAWRVVKVADRRWHLVSSLNDAVFEYFTTKKAAEAARTDGWAATLYEKEGRWFRGELIPMWKPYAEVAAEQRQRASQQDAGRAACDRDWAVGVPLDLAYAATQTPSWRTGYRLRHEELVASATMRA